MRSLKRALTGLAIPLCFANAAYAEDTPKPPISAPAQAADGAVTVPSYKLPPLVYLSPEARAVLAKGIDPNLPQSKPPMAAIAGIRAGMKQGMAPLVDALRRLIRNGVHADLHIWDGLGHAFYALNPEMPESREALNVIADFFITHLTKKGRK
jgi:hypothetical protein